jgi:galactokinase
VAGVVAELRPPVGLEGTVSSTLPVGAGLSSSAALEVAVALALGFDGGARALAELCQRAEQRASGVPCGVMDQLASAAGVAGHALLLDCTSLEVVPVALPDDVEVVAVHSGEARQLAGSAYADRRAQVEAAQAIVGPLRDTRIGDLAAIRDPVLHRRARHVVTENERVHTLAEALRRDDVAAAGALVVESHTSLRDDFAVSTPALDALVERLVATPGVYGARLTGAGFGGCAVALARPGAVRDGHGVWRLQASGPAARNTA